MATSELARGSVALTCLKDRDTPIPSTLVLSYLSLGVLCYQCSIFFNLALTLLRTVQLASPFFRVNPTLLKTTLLTAPVLALCLTIGDAVCWDRALDSTPTCFHHWVKLEAVSYLGEGVAVHFTEGRELQVVGGVLLHAEYSLPCLLVLVCMVVQLWFIKRGLAGESGQDTARHASTTILLVSALYFLSNSAFVITFTLSRLRVFNLTTKYYKVLLMTVKFTLPLLNAALFPLIIILRKASLRSELKEMFWKLLHSIRAGYTRMVTGIFGATRFVRLQENVTEEDSETKQ